MAPYILRPFLSLIGQVYASEGDAKSRGWSENINWLTLKEGQKTAQTERKPLMVIIHNPGCNSCKALKSQFSRSGQIAQLSKRLVMVNLDSGEDEIPSDSDFAPDGLYVPRIVFFTPDGRLMANAYNASRRQYRFTYESTSELVNTINAVLGPWWPKG